MRKVFVIGAGMMLLAGCGASTPTSSPTTTAAADGATSSVSSTPVATHDATATTPATATATATVPARVSALPLGKEHSFAGRDGVQARVTAFSINQNAPSVAKPQNGGHWASADVQYCLDAVPARFIDTLSWSSWALLDSTYGRYPASSSTYEGMPLPRYPNGSAPIAVGECARGSIVFVVPSGVTVAAVRYAPSDTDPVSWAP